MDNVQGAYDDDINNKRERTIRGQGHVTMATTGGLRPLVHRQSAMMETFRDHSSMTSADLQQKQLESNPALTVAFQNYEKCAKLLVNYKNRTVDFFSTMSRKLKTLVLFSFEDFPDEEDRRVLGDKLVTIGFIHHAIEYYNLVMDELGITAVTMDFLADLSPDEEEQSSVLYKIREILWNFSDSSNNLSEAIAKTDLLHKLAVDLDAIADDGIETLESYEDMFPFGSAVGIIHNGARSPAINKETLSIFGLGNPSPLSSHQTMASNNSMCLIRMPFLRAYANGDSVLKNDLGKSLSSQNYEDMFPFSSAVGIIHNCARNPAIDKEVFRKIGIVGSLLPFLKSKNLYVKMICVLALGNIIKEHEVQMLDADTDIFDFILNAMKQASYTKHRKEFGFHLAELCDGLASLAKSDQNKQLIMEKEPLRLIKDLLTGHSIAEILAAIKLVWELAFLPANKVILSREKDILTAIKSLRKNKNEGISLAAKKTWFVLAGKDERIREEESSKETGTKRGQHIMFSYNWVDKDIVDKIYEQLKMKGYPLWIDTMEMGKFDSILDGMAYAVDNAYIILVCYSEKYKNSQNCRTEADYAFTKRKEIVPLKMQRGYNPDGWLGALIGARFFVEFSPQKPFDNQITATVQQIEKFKVPDKDPAPSSFKPALPPDNVPATHSKHAHFGPVKPRPQTVITRNVKDWKKHDIEHWAKENKLEGYALKRITTMSGEQLYFVYTLSIKKPDTFYRWAETNLRLGSIEDLMRFHDALECLVTHV